MKLLILSRYSRLGASSRLRMIQYWPYLTELGFDIEWASFFDDDYLEALYAGRLMRASSASYFLRRILRLARPISADLIWLEKEALPWFPWFLEKLLIARNIPLISDYDDAVFHRYDLHRSPFIRATLGKKIDQVMKHSALVTAGNDYLFDRALTASAPVIEILPTVVDMSKYALAWPRGDERSPRIGWIGTPETWTNFVLPMKEMLREAAVGNGMIFRAVGASQSFAEEPGIEFLPWSEETEIQTIHGMDIGIMPLPQTPWAMGKCGYKLIQYMACGLPVVASPVGANRKIIEHGVNGFFAETDDEWREAFGRLSDRDVRKRMGMAGREKIEREYSLQVHGPRVARRFREIAQSRLS